MGKIKTSLSALFSKNLIANKMRTAFILLFIGHFFHAQTFSGIVLNTQKQPLQKAIVNIFLENTEELIDYTLTDSQGKFSISVPQGSYTIIIQSLGYHKKQIPLKINDNQKTQIVLEQDVQEIKEVVVTKINPIKIKTDTVEYNAQSFRDGTERSVQDLLKKLPGIVVEQDGKIKINNKEIEKVTVENDDFFEKGYTLLTKNMSQKPIDKVQVIENYSNNKLLKGVEKSDKVIINLTLEENTKTEWFGELQLANSIFPNDYYDNKLSLARFDKKYKLFLLGAVNSVGRDNTGNIHHLIQPSSSTNEAGMINIPNNVYPYDSDFAPAISIDNERFKLNKDKLVSNNIILRLAKNMKLKWMNLFNFERINNSRLTSTQYTLGDLNFQTSEQELKSFKKNTYFNKIEYDYEISKKNTLKYLMSYTIWDAHNSENSNLNDIPYLYNSDTKNHLLDAQLLHTYRLKKSSAFLTGLRYYNQNIKNQYTTNQFFFDDLFNFTNSPDNLQQFSNNRLNYFGVINQLIHRNQRDDVWNIALLYTHHEQEFSNHLNANSNGTDVIFPTEFNNDFKTNNNELILTTKYDFKYDNINFNTEINFNYWNTKSNHLDKNLWYINPSFGLKFSPHTKGNFNTSIFMNRRKNDIYERLPNYFSDSPRSFRKGLENELLAKNYGVNLGYNYGRFTDKFSFSVHAFWMNHQKYQTSSYSFHPQYTISDLLYLNNRKEIFLSTELNYYLRFLKSNLKLRYLNSTNRYQEALETLGWVDVKSISQSFGLELQSGWKKKVNYTLATTLRYNKVQSNTTSNILNHKAYLRVHYAISKSYFLELYNYYYSFAGMFNKNNAYNFLDLKLSFNASDKIQFALSGNNLTNTKLYAEKLINSYSNYISTTQMFSRNIMLEFSYNFGN